MTVKLHTDDFKIPLDATFRQYLVANFKVIEQELNGLENFYNSLPDYVKSGSAEDLKTSINKEIKSTVDDLNSRINRIMLGTDSESIELVVTQILKEKGVIK